MRETRPVFNRRLMAWMFSVLLALALIVTWAVPTAVRGSSADPSISVPIGLRGDATGDGLVDMADVVYVERVIMEMSPTTPGCDPSYDGRVDMADVVFIERLIIGWSVRTPVLGDADNDGFITIGDMLVIEREILGKSLPTPGADSNGDGVINIADVVVMYDLILGVN